MPGKQAVGRIVIEAREAVARATVYIQDLSPQSSYKLAFVRKADDTNLGVIIGTIIVDERGRYEGKFEFDRGNIGGSGISCEGIDACIVLLSGGEEEFAAPLVGYRAAPFSWRVNLNFPDGKSESPILEVKQVEDVEVDKEDVVEEVCEEVEETEDVKEESVEVEEMISEEVVVEVEEVPPSVYDFTEEDVVVDVISHLFQGDNNVVDIFANSDKFPDAQWIVTDLQSIEGFAGDEIVQNGLVKECVSKHKHVLLGRDSSTYILGIPDIYDITLHNNEHEFYHMFDSFKMCNPSDPVKGAHGYWLKQL